MSTTSLKKQIPSSKRVLQNLLNAGLLAVGAAGALSLSLASGATSEGLPERFFAPYVDATLYPKFDLAGTAQSQGTLYYTLAFVVAAGDMNGINPLDPKGDGSEPPLDPSTLASWGAQNTLRVNGDYMKADIEALKALGGGVMLSFGGQANIGLAGLYSNPFDENSQASEYQQRESANVLHLKQAYQFVIDRYELTHIDFDIEGQWVAHPYSIQLRAKAIKALQQDAAAAERMLVVWYTLPALPNGLDGNGMNALNNALATGVDLAGINIMAMDYGSVAPIIDPATGVTATKPNIPPRENDNPATGVDADDKGMMGDYGIQSAQGLFTQMKGAFSAHGIVLSDAEIWRKIGITPMIGVNDVQEEVVDLSEAAEIYQFALSKDIGMLSFWSITRDHPAPAGKEGAVDANFSGLSEPSYAFTHLMLPFSGDGSEAIYVSDASVEEGDTGSKTVELTLWRLPASNETRVINWSTSDGSAVAGDDYVSASSTLSFAPGETVKTFTVTILNESIVEDDEKFMVNFSTTSGVPIPDAQATVTIRDDDMPPSASIDDQSVSEDVGSAEFTVTLSRPVKAGLTATIAYQVEPGTASSGGDFTAISGSLSFTGSETSKTITVDIIDSPTVETDEVFLVTLSSPIYVTLADRQGLGTIEDDDAIPVGGYLWDIPDDWGNGWRGVLTFTNPGPNAWDPWQLSFDSTWPVDPNSVWTGAYNEALSSDDGAGNYHHVFNAKSWEPSAIQPDASGLVEFTISGSPSSAPSNVMANGSPLTAINQGPGVSVNDVSTAEGDSGQHSIDFTVSLSQAGTAPIHVAYAVVAGSATPTVDYTAGNGTVVFAAGEKTKTVSVTVLSDTLEEGDETVQIFLAGVDGEPLPRIADAQGILTITGDDWTPSITTTAAILREKDSGTRTATITVTLNRAPKATESISVAYQTTDASATAGSDYVAKSGSLEFATGQTEQTLNFTINGDQDDERLERFTVDFSSPLGCLLADDHAEVHIIDDDSGSGELEGRRVVAYVYGGGALPPANKVTHINYAFSNLNTNGSWAFSGNLSGLKNLRNTNPNLKILVSIGGWGWSENFSSVADDPVKRARFAASAASLIDSQDLDGVDIDWEWPGAQGDGDTPPGPRDRENFTKLMQETRDAIDALGVSKGRTYELTAFTGAGSAQIAGMDLAAIGEIFDFINVQGYDLHGPWDPVTGHAAGLHYNPADPAGASLNIEAILNTYAAAGIPRDKLLVGVAFYGRKMWTSSSDNWGLFQGHGWGGDTPLYNAIIKNNQSSHRYFWDDVAKAAWLYQDSNGSFVTFDDPRSCAEKAEYARANGYGGVYFWQMGGDTGDFQLLTTLYDSSLSLTPVDGDSDSDSDGMDDAWEIDHFGDKDTAAAGTDFDHDGQSDLAEFQSGHDPKNSADFFHVGSLVLDGGVTLKWASVPGKLYNVEYSSDLAPGSWATIATGLSGGSFTDTDTGRQSQPSGFYRLSLP